jgi:hypothetical protein
VFSRFENSLQCDDENDDSEEAIVEQIAVKHQNNSEDRESDEDATIKRERLSNQDSRKFIAGLRPHFMQKTMKAVQY